MVDSNGLEIQPSEDEKKEMDAWDNEPQMTSQTSYTGIFVPAYAIIDMDKIETSMQECLNKIIEEFSMSEDDSITLLKAYRWNTDKLHQKYLEDHMKVKYTCGLLSDPSQKVEQTESPNCLICYEPIAGKALDNVACGHTFCSVCWKGYCESAVKSEKDCVLTRCPLVGCPVVVPKSIFKKYLSPDLFKEYNKLICKSYTDENKMMKWCPAPGCKFIACNESLSRIDVACKCGKIFCFGCGEESHIPCTCPITKKWLIKNSAESENITWILANTKACPGCQKFIEKNQGCNHMTCKACKHEFCWICMGDWKIHGEATGGYYKCNRYENELKANKELKSMEEKRESAKSELAKYSFYFERYNNHDKAMKLAMKGIPMADEKIMLLHNKKNYPFSELQFLKNAAEEMVNIRRVLKNSYVYGYFLEEKTEKELFENLQGQLEDNCDHLHQLLEQNLEDFVKEDVVSTTPFDMYKSKLTNYFEVTKKVCLHINIT